MHKFIAIYNLKIAIYNYPLHIWASLQPSTCSGPSQQMALQFRFWEDKFFLE